MEKPYFVNGKFKWYIEKDFQELIENQQKHNLPILKGIGAFRVNDGIKDEYVLIDNEQNVLAVFNYNSEGKGQMEARINIMKIAEHYECN